jgi:hypothetical protein
VLGTPVMWRERVVVPASLRAARHLFDPPARPSGVTAVTQPGDGPSARVAAAGGKSLRSARPIMPHYQPRPAVTGLASSADGIAV